jgi:ribosome-binding protein aMBF1 (putative translation factor)
MLKAKYCYLCGRVISGERSSVLREKAICDDCQKIRELRIFELKTEAKIKA